MCAHARARRLSPCELRSQGQKTGLLALHQMTWFYAVRSGGEANKQTEERLLQVVDWVFPRRSRSEVIPREAPVDDLVGMIHCMSQVSSGLGERGSRAPLRASLTRVCTAL